MTPTETATIKAQADQEQRQAWMWLLDRLKDYVDLRGMRPEDDERLAQLHEDTYFEAQFMIDPKGEVGPTVDIMSAFRENPALWLEACPSDQVVVLPRGIITRLLAALPVSTDALGSLRPSLEMIEYHGHAFLREGAYRHKRAREDEEMAAGQRAKIVIDRVIAEHAASSAHPAATED